MIEPAPLPRLYAICDVDLIRSRRLDPIAVFDTWIECGLRLIQLRAKSLSVGAVLDLADDMVGRAHAAGVAVVINDHADVARLCAADGVHVGQHDMPPAAARRAVGELSLVGLSTHDVTQVERAVREPISYLAIGPVFPTTTKARPDPVVGLEGVTQAAARCAASGLPLVAIGGVTIDRAPAVVAAGASSIAVAADLIGDDPGARARAWVAAAATWDAISV